MHELRLRVGPAAFRLGSPWAAPIAALDRLYAGYPRPEWTDFTVRLDPARPWRRWLRPAVMLSGDYSLAGTSPLPLTQGLLALEMGMNLQMALGWRRHLLLHAAVVERGGAGMILTGPSGSGKSTLAAILGERGWRLLGDEFALLDPSTGELAPFVRAVSLKNESLDALGAVAPGRWGPLLTGTPKGSIRHLAPSPGAVAAMDRPAQPQLVLFPRFGHRNELRPVGRDEAFVRLTQGSTNYGPLGEAGFAALLRLVRQARLLALDYREQEFALETVERLVEGAA